MRILIHILLSAIRRLRDLADFAGRACGELRHGARGRRGIGPSQRDRAADSISADLADQPNDSGLLTFVIIGGCVELVAWLVPGFQVDGFLWALAFAAVLWPINTFLHTLQTR